MSERIKFEKRVEGQSRENEYAREVIRIIELLKTKVSEEEAVRIAAELEKIAKENDEVVAQILGHPKVKETYDIDEYDGKVLFSKLLNKLSAHFIRDGLWKMRNLTESVLIRPFMGLKGEYNDGALLEWFRQDLDFNKVRLEQIQKTGDLLVTDPNKVRVKKRKQEELPKNKEEDKIIFH